MIVWTLPDGTLVQPRSFFDYGFIDLFKDSSKRCLFGTETDFVRIRNLCIRLYPIAVDKGSIG